jgi:hypothetical protein
MSPIAINPVSPNLPCCRRNNAKGKDQLIFETTAGQRVTLSELSASILIEDANGNSIRLDGTGITITSASNIQIVSAASVAVTAPADTVNSAMTRFTGVLQADTLIANSVVASSYSPGAGNLS